MVSHHYVTDPNEVPNIVAALEEKAKVITHRDLLPPSIKPATTETNAAST